MDHYLRQWRALPAPRKRLWFVLLTPTGPLADQQGLVLANDCDLSLVDEEDVDAESDGEGASYCVGVVRGHGGQKVKASSGWDIELWRDVEGDLIGRMKAVDH